MRRESGVNVPPILSSRSISSSSSHDSEDTQETKVSCRSDVPRKEPLQESSVNVEEDLDFQTARRKLVERSQGNGNDVNTLPSQFSMARRQAARFDRVVNENNQRASLAGLDYSALV